MARDISNNTPIENISALVATIEAGNKPKQDWRIGTEHEKFGFYKIDNSPVPYGGPCGIRALLEGMQEKTDWDPIIDDGNIIGLVAKDGLGAISLEPGGQFELSGSPLETLHETCRESNRHLTQVREVAEPLGIGFLGLGGSPKWSLSETPQMPKSRYNIMSNYMPKVGSQGLDMMYRTCTIQVNLDFSSETDMRTKMQVATKLQPVAAALFANSPFTNGEPNGLLSWRSDIWRDTDNQRSGLLPFVFDKNFGFEQYVDWALDVPMYFVLRDGQYHDCTHITFRQFMDGALRDELPDWAATMGDWENHLGTLFPDVRLKKFLEMRGADGGPWRRICALPAFWVGLLYDENALAQAEELTRNFTYDEVFAMRESVPREALNAMLGDTKVLDITKSCLEIARAGLIARNRLNVEGGNEAHFLASLEEVAALGETSAERMLKYYASNWDRDIDHVFEEFAF